MFKAIWLICDYVCVCQLLNDSYSRLANKIKRGDSSIIIVIFTLNILWIFELCEFYYWVIGYTIF
jgi:hypothetical protein